MSSSISAAQLADILRAGSPAFNSPVNTLGCDHASEHAHQDDSCAVKHSISELGTSVETAKPASVAEKLVALPLVDSDTRGGVVQPACLRQWHSNVCGHHALFNIQCLLEGQAERFLRCLFMKPFSKGAGYHMCHDSRTLPPHPLIT